MQTVIDFIKSCIRAIVYGVVYLLMVAVPFFCFFVLPITLMGTAGEYLFGTPPLEPWDAIGLSFAVTALAALGIWAFSKGKE